MRKMSDMNIIGDTLNELEDEYGYNTSVIDKKAFNINIDPSSVIGAITGAAVANRQAKKNLMRERLENNKVIGGSYYKQVQNISDNMKVTFTPFNVLILIKNGTQQITIDSIDVDEMDSSMKDAYRRKDAEFFKRLILNKIKSEIQLAEQMFARRVVQKQLELQNQMTNKQASTEDLTFGDVLNNICGIKEIFEKNAESKFGDILIKVAGGDTVSIELDLDDIRPFNKYANIFKDTLSFFGFDIDKKNIRELQGKMMNPNYLKNHIKVGFLPNRVAFVVDNMMVTQIPVLGMNEEGFEAFQRGDQKYFKELFIKELNKKANASQQTAKIPAPTPPNMEKKAEVINDDSIASIFKKSEIHPKVYYLELMKSFGDEWIELSPEVLVKEIEEKYGLKDGIDDIPLNKILVIQLANKSDSPFTNYHVFEKCVRALNDKPIDFQEREDNLGLGEIVFALKVMQDLTPHDDIYDNFSPAIFDYVADVLVKNDYRAVAPTMVVGSELEKGFYNLLNEEISEAWDNLLTENVTNRQEANRIKIENRYVLNSVRKVVDTLRSASEYNPEAINYVVDTVVDRLNLSASAKNAIHKNVSDSMAIDVYLEHKDKDLKEQLDHYGI